MPAALDVNWGEIKALAIAVGVREAARRMGISEEAVMQRSSREGWLRDLPRSTPLPPTVIQPVSVVSNAGDLLKQELAERGAKSRLALAKGLGKAADHVGGLEGPSVLDKAQDIKALTASLATVHAWDATSAQVRVDLRVTSDRQAPTTVDAEWRDVPEQQGFVE